MPDGKRCKMSLGLEPSPRTGSLYADGTFFQHRISPGNRPFLRIIGTMIIS